MPANDFNTVPEELLHVAADSETRFRNEGYNVEIEKREIGFPFTPTLLCKRGHETVIVEVSSSIDRLRTERWIRYAKSQVSDTRLCLFVRMHGNIDQNTLAYVHETRLGLCIHNDVTIIEMRAPTDLAVHVQLPDITDLSPALRPLLAPAFRKVRENDWRDGLNDAYGEVEQLAREYLKTGINSGRIAIIMGRRNNPRPLTVADVDQMTLGQLKDAFGRISIQTYKDSVIGTTLAMINQTRIGLAHRRRSATTEANLRQNVGQHMYAAITCLEELTS